MSRGVLIFVLVKSIDDAFLEQQLVVDSLGTVVEVDVMLVRPIVICDVEAVLEVNTNVVMDEVEEGLVVVVEVGLY